MSCSCSKVIKFWLSIRTRLSNLLGPSNVAMKIDSSSVRPIRPFKATRRTKSPLRSCQQYKELFDSNAGANSPWRLSKTSTRAAKLWEWIWFWPSWQSVGEHLFQTLSNLLWLKVDELTPKKGHSKMDLPEQLDLDLPISSNIHFLVNQPTCWHWLPWLANHGICDERKIQRL